MERVILGFHRDEVGDWVAELSCQHFQHVRHHPPFRLAPWVEDDAERAERIGSALDCPLCDRAELPTGLRVVWTTETWDEVTMPAGLRRAHRLAPGVWGRLQVEQGQLRFQAGTRPSLDRVLDAGATQPIPPEVDHQVAPRGRVRFLIEFLGR